MQPSVKPRPPTLCHTVCLLKECNSHPVNLMRQPVPADKLSHRVSEPPPPPSNPAAPSLAATLQMLNGYLMFQRWLDGVWMGRQGVLEAGGCWSRSSVAAAFLICFYAGVRCVCGMCDVCGVRCVRGILNCPESLSC